MKKILSVVGLVLSILALFGAMIAPISRWWALAPMAILIGCVLLLCVKAPAREEDEEGTPRVRRSVNWPLVIAWTLTALAFAATVLVAILAGWFCLIPLAILFGLLVWVAYLHSWGPGWCWVFIIAAILTVLVGVIFWGFVTLGGGANIDGDIDTLNVNHLNVQDATIGNAHVTDSKVENQEVENATVSNQVVENQEVENQEVENATVSNQVVENQEVENQVVENQTVKDQVVENQIVQPTEPTPTEPKPTEPAPTEPKPTEPVHKHSYKSAVTEPTCMEQGYTTHTCDCGHSYKDSYKGALGHSYKETVVAPTTETKGYTLHECSRCGHSYKDAYTDKLPAPTAPPETEPAVVPAIKCAGTIRYGETVYVNLEGISASNLKVSNKAFVSVEKISDTRVAITLTEDVTGYITITDSTSGTNVVIDIVS